VHVILLSARLECLLFCFRLDWSDWSAKFILLLAGVQNLSCFRPDWNACYFAFGPIGVIGVQNLFCFRLGVQNLFCFRLECKIYFAFGWSAKFILLSARLECKIYFAFGPIDNDFFWECALCISTLHKCTS